MSNASISAYSLQSTLPRDVAGYKFMGWVRSDASVAPFTLPRGIGTSTNESGYMFSHLGVSSHTQGSKIEANHPGMALMGVFLQDGNLSGSKVESGQAQLIQSTRKGELIVSGACKIPIMDATSANIYTLGSGLLHGGYITGAGVTAGDNVLIKSNTNTVFNITFESANQTIPLNVPAGGIYFGASITHSRTISGGATSVTLFVERP
jgi:hypothetical protein